jgi:SnoaL-like domain
LVFGVERRCAASGSVRREERSAEAGIGCVMTAAEIVLAYVSAWNDDDVACHNLLGRAWAEDGVYCHPMGRAEGRDALGAHIAAVQAGFPGHRIEVVSSVDEHDGYLRFAWELRVPDQSMVVEGVDFGVLAPDGRLASITGFFGPLSPREA